MQEINLKLAKELFDDPRPLEDRSPSPEPIYNDAGRHVNSRAFRVHQKLEIERHELVQRVMQMIPELKSICTPQYDPTYKTKLCNHFQVIVTLTSQP